MRLARRCLPWLAAGIPGESGGDSNHSNRQLGSGIRNRPAVPGRICGVVQPSRTDRVLEIRLLPIKGQGDQKVEHEATPTTHPSSISTFALATVSR